MKPVECICAKPRATLANPCPMHGEKTEKREMKPVPFSLLFFSNLVTLGLWVLITGPVVDFFTGQQVQLQDVMGAFSIFGVAYMVRFCHKDKGAGKQKPVRHSFNVQVVDPLKGISYDLFCECPTCKAYRAAAGYPK